MNLVFRIRGKVKRRLRQYFRQPMMQFASLCSKMSSSSVCLIQDSYLFRRSLWWKSSIEQRCHFLPKRKRDLTESMGEQVCNWLGHGYRQRRFESFMCIV